MSKLEEFFAKELRMRLGSGAVWRNYRPDWLAGVSGCALEMDIYLPQQRLVIEIQGQQHFNFVPHFHGEYERFQAQQERDKLKRQLLKQRGLRLIEVTSESDLQYVIDALERRSSKRAERAPSRTKQRRAASLEKNISRCEEQLLHKKLLKPRRAYFVRLVVGCLAGFGKQGGFTQAQQSNREMKDLAGRLQVLVSYILKGPAKFDLNPEHKRDLEAYLRWCFSQR